MQTEKLTEIISREWTLRPINVFYPQIKSLRREIFLIGKTKQGFPEKRLLEKELGILLKTHKGYYINTFSETRSAGEIQPVLGALISALREINHDTVINYVSRITTVKPLGSYDVDSLIWQAKFCVIKNAVASMTGGSENQHGEKQYNEKLAMLTDIDTDVICTALNPLEKLYSEDYLYTGLTSATRELYRRMTAETAVAAGLEEIRLSKEYMNRLEQDFREQNHKKNLSEHLNEHESKIFLKESDSDKTNCPEPDKLNINPEYNHNYHHIGEIIMKDYRRIFPFINLKRYLWGFFIISIIFTLSAVLLTGQWLFLLAFLPVMAVVKPVIDYITIKSVRSTGTVPSIDLNREVPENAKTLCVISTLLSSKKDAEEGLKKLCEARLKNNSKNIKFALLCDLKPANSERVSDDEEILKSARKVFGSNAIGSNAFGSNAFGSYEDFNEDFVILIRNRKYCKTQDKWQGEERKRGAILALSKLLRSGNIKKDLMEDKNCSEYGFRSIYGDYNALSEIRYICALDYDTVPLMDSISELVGVALHPLHKNKGIIAPRITTSLSSYLKTGFSRVMAGNGGCAGASAYDSFSGEMYQDCFGEGIFTGKGLIDVDLLLSSFNDEKNIKEDYSDGKKRFPPERILSHDILEGGCIGVVFAGNIEFSDSFPDTSRAYFKRQNRWLRGDLQNSRYIFDNKFSSLTRWKLADNVRRAVTPIFIMLCFIIAVLLKTPLLMLTALLSIIMPYLMGFVPSVIRGRRFANYRRFYSPVISQTKQLLRQCIMEIMLAPKNALVSFDALVRTLWRTFISKKHLLDWTTSAAFENMKLGSIHMLGSELLSLLLLIYAGINGNFPTLAICVLFLSALPVLLFSDRTSGRHVQKIPHLIEKELVENIQKMWNFYTDWVTEEHSFLPPDNVQYSPVFRVAARTSPTNIGMYLLSIICVRFMGLIDNKELEDRIHKTLSTVEKLKKWHGNLMNWYDTRSLAVISSFVSSVDSGNFVCSLVAVKEGLKRLSCDGMMNLLVLRMENIINDTNLKPFYNNSRKLFSIGFDMESGELSRHNYDLIMSESRILSYYAVATGQADKNHWRALGRVMGRDGCYAAPVSWTGTMFEYFMPELLLSSKEGSMEYEALRFSLHCQQKRARETGLPFGISESGYYAFDEALNYQYKAHGVQAVGLKAGLNKERVVSPYSSFLSMAYDPLGSYGNLVKLEKLGACHSKYGFYEAVDFTKQRVGSGHAVVKSHMAHHVGMSIAGATNAIKDGVLQKLFLSDEKMKRADEILEEKIIAGEPVLGSPERQEEEILRANAKEICKFSLEAVQVNALSNGTLTVICTDIGFAETYYERKSIFYRTTDLRRPRGSVYAFVENEHIMPFFNHPLLPDETGETEQSVIFMQNSTEYYRNFRNLCMGMQVFLHPEKPVEIRRFAVENDSSIKRQLTLAIYIEPVLARFRDISAHPAFMDLFLNIVYDENNKLVIVSRKERNSDNETVMAAGFINSEDFTLSFNRENIITRNGGIFSALEHARERENQTTSVPAPCVFIKADFPLDAHGKRESELFFCYGDSIEKVISIANEIRKEKLNPSEEIISPLVADTIYGRLTKRILPHILYSPKSDKQSVNNNIHDIRAIWRFGISGDLPIVIYEFNGKASGADSTAEMKKALSLCQIEFDLIVLYDTEAEKQLADQLKSELGIELFCISKNNTESNILTLIKAAAVYILKSSELLLELEKAPETVFLPIKQCRNPYLNDIKDENNSENNLNYFNKQSTEGEFFINESAGLPWCHVIAGTQFGTLVSDRALGFSWALNSRENKLTPWENDIRSDNKGEMLLLKFGGSVIYDIIDGSQVVFSPNKAVYTGSVKSITAKTTVRVYEKGMGKALEVELENNSKQARTIELAYYTEPVLGVERGLPNSRTRFIKPVILDNESDSSNSIVFINPSNNTLSGAMVVSCDYTGKADNNCFFTTDRNAFWEGEWNGKNNNIKPACDIIGAVIIKIELPPKYKDKIKFILSFTKNITNPLSMKNAFSKIGYAKAFPAKNNINSGDYRLDILYKYWLPWQTVGARMWARTGFYQNSGAYGYRDQLQDCLCAVKVNPQIAERQIYRACCAQFQEGDVLHWWHDLLSVKKGVRTRYSDDLLWLPYVLAEYVRETGNLSILKKTIYFCEGEELKPDEHEKYMEVIVSAIKATVYNHAKRSLDKAYKKGEHGLLLMGCGDWCDGYNNVGLKGKGESVWLSMFYIMTAEKFKTLSEQFDDLPYSDILIKRANELKTAIEENAWDGEYYLRAFYDDMRAMGSVENDQCKIDLLPQAFAALASLPNEKRTLTALLSAEQLCDKHYKLIKLFNPPFKRGKTWQEPGYVMSYPEGVRENGGQYTHAAVWLAMAFHKMGILDTAEELARMLAPFGRNDEYKTEPYYMSADIYTNPQAYGRGGWSIYTGSAGWYFNLLGDIFGENKKERNGDWD